MKHKAQNVIEVIALVSIVAVTILAWFMLTTDKSVNITNLSKVDKLAQISSNEINQLNGPNSVNRNNNITETAGSLSNYVIAMSKTELENALTNKSIEQITIAKSANGEDIFDLANALIDELNLRISPFDKNDLSDDIKEKLVQVAEEAKNVLNGGTSSVYINYTALLAQIIKD